MKYRGGDYVNKTKFTSMQVSPVKACLIGSVVSAMLLILLSLLSAVFVNNDIIELKSSRNIAWFIIFASCFVGCALTGKLAKKNIVACCGIVGAVVLIIQLAAAILVFEGMYNNFFIGMLPVLSGFGCAILLNFRGKSASGVNKKRRRRG